MSHSEDPYLPIPNDLDMSTRSGGVWILRVSWVSFFFEKTWHQLSFWGCVSHAEFVSWQ